MFMVSDKCNFQYVSAILHHFVNVLTRGKQSTAGKFSRLDPGVDILRGFSPFFHPFWLCFGMINPDAEEVTSK